MRRDRSSGAQFSDSDTGQTRSFGQARRRRRRRHCQFRWQRLAKTESVAFPAAISYSKSPRPPISRRWSKCPLPLFTNRHWQVPRYKPKSLGHLGFRRVLPSRIGLFLDIIRCHRVFARFHRASSAIAARVVFRWTAFSRVLLGYYRPTRVALAFTTGPKWTQGSGYRKPNFSLGRLHRKKTWFDRVCSGRLWSFFLPRFTSFHYVSFRFIESFSLTGPYWVRLDFNATRVATSFPLANKASRPKWTQRLGNRNPTSHLGGHVLRRKLLKFHWIIGYARFVPV